VQSLRCANDDLFWPLVDASIWWECCDPFPIRELSSPRSHLTVRGDLHPSFHLPYSLLSSPLLHCRSKHDHWKLSLQTTQVDLLANQVQEMEFLAVESIRCYPISLISGLTSLSRSTNDWFIPAEKWQIHVNITCWCKAGDLLQVRLRDMCNTVGQGNTSRMGGGHKRVSKEAFQAG